MRDPIGVILAGGQSRRMGGGDKCLLSLDGTSVLDRVIARLEPQVTRIILNANGAPDRFAQTGLPVVADSIGGFAGPLAGVLAGLDRAAEEGASHIVTVAADTPFFPSSLVSGLGAAAIAQDKPLAMAMTPDPERGFARHPTFGLWPVDLRDNLRAALNEGVSKVILWTEPLGCAKMVFEGFDYDPFFNINTAEDFAEAEAMIKKYGL